MVVMGWRGWNLGWGCCILAFFQGACVRGEEKGVVDRGGVESLADPAPPVGMLYQCRTALCCCVAYRMPCRNMHAATCIGLPVPKTVGRAMRIYADW